MSVGSPTTTKVAAEAAEEKALYGWLDQIQPEETGEGGRNGKGKGKGKGKKGSR